MTTGIDTPTVNHLGAVIHKLREHCAGPPWDAPGIRSALERSLAEWPYPKVVDVATATALDTTAKTPMAIPHRLRNGWSAPKPDQPGTQTPPKVSTLRCQRCGLLKLEGDDHHCARISDAHEGAAKARAELAAARATHTDTEEDSDGLPDA